MTQSRCTHLLLDADGAPLREPLVAQVEAAVRHGAHGVAVLGLATETNKLDTDERRRILEWTARRSPVACRLR